MREREEDDLGEGQLRTLSGPKACGTPVKWNEGSSKEDESRRCMREKIGTSVPGNLAAQLASARRSQQ